MAESFVKLEINSFLFNAGIVGTRYLLAHTRAREGKDEDYWMDGNALCVKKSCLSRSDLAEAYMSAHIEKFKEDAPFTRILAEMDTVEDMTRRYQAEQSDSLRKKLNEKYNNYLLHSSGLLRASYLSALTGLESDLDLKEACKKIKLVKDLEEKLRALRSLRETITMSPYREAFLMKDIIYSRINAIWSNKAFLNMANAKKKITEVYAKDFVLPLQDFLRREPPPPNKKAKNCIECDVRSADLTEISFLNDTADDMARKKSSFWNYKPDALICPLCAFVYSLAPLGFTAMGRNLVFINGNTSVENLVRMNESLSARAAIASKDKENETYRTVLNRVAHGTAREKIKNLSNIQVIVREKAAERYQFNVVARDTLNILRDCLPSLEKLEKIAVEINSKTWLSVYQSVLENLFSRSNQYGLLNTLLRHSLKQHANTLYLKHVINIQNRMRGGSDVEKKNADNAFYRGRELREIICGDRGGKEDADNRLRGFVYQLLNALQTNDSEKFWYLILKMYSGLSRPVPKIFLETFSSDEELRYLGYAYIVGLKNEKYVAEDKAGEEVKA